MNIKHISNNVTTFNSEITNTELLAKTLPLIRFLLTGDYHHALPKSADSYLFTYPDLVPEKVALELNLNLADPSKVIVTLTLYKATHQEYVYDSELFSAYQIIPDSRKSFNNPRVLAYAIKDTVKYLYNKLMLDLTKDKHIKESASITNKQYDSIIKHIDKITHCSYETYVDTPSSTVRRINRSLSELGFKWVKFLSLPYRGEGQEIIRFSKHITPDAELFIDLLLESDSRIYLSNAFIRPSVNSSLPFNHLGINFNKTHDYLWTWQFNERNEDLFRLIHYAINKLIFTLNNKLLKRYHKFISANDIINKLVFTDNLTNYNQFPDKLKSGIQFVNTLYEVSNHIGNTGTLLAQQFLLPEKSERVPDSYILLCHALHYMYFMSYDNACCFDRHYLIYFENHESFMGINLLYGESDTLFIYFNLQAKVRRPSISNNEYQMMVVKNVYQLTQPFDSNTSLFDVTSRIKAIVTSAIIDIIDQCNNENIVIDSRELREHLMKFVKDTNISSINTAPSTVASLIKTYFITKDTFGTPVNPEYTEVTLVPFEKIVSNIDIHQGIGFNYFEVKSQPLVEKSVDADWLIK